MENGKFEKWFNRIFIILSITILIILITQYYPYILQREATSAKFIIIKPIIYGGINVEDPPGALLITDEEEIQYLNVLLATHYRGSNACGPTIEVEFWLDNLNFESSHFITEDCEWYTRKLNKYFDKAHDEPTHYMYNLKIPASKVPEVILTDFASQGQILTSSSHDLHLPFIILKKEFAPETGNEWLNENTASAEMEMYSYVQKISNEYSIQSIGKLENHEFIQNGGGCVATLEIKFQPDTDITDIETLFPELVEIIYELRIPTHYYLQFITEQKDIDLVREFLRENFTYIEGVYRYPLTE